jgi:hypothetical protein
VLLHFRKITALCESWQASPVYLSEKSTVNAWQWSNGGIIMTEIPKYSEENLSQYHFFDHESYKAWPGVNFFYLLAVRKNTIDKIM